MSRVTEYCERPGYGQAFHARLACRFAGAALLVAAATKVVLPAGQLHGPLILGEALMGLWLVSGWKCNISGWLAAALFAVFAAVSSWKAIQGLESCGCFGRLVVPPWLTASMNVSLLAALVASFYPSESASKPRTAFTSGCFAFTVTFALMVVATIAIPSASQSLRVHEPHHWLQKPLPIGGDIEIDADLRMGHWELVFYRHDCPRCVEVFDRYAERRKMITTVAAPAVAFVEVPPYGDAHFPPATFRRGRIVDKDQWFIRTPLVVSLRQGIVMAVEFP